MMRTPILTASLQLHEAPERGGLTGFGTLLRKEMGAWWSTRRWWMHALLWLALMNGFMVPVYFVVQAHPEANLDLVDQLTKIFFSLGGTTVAIGAIVVGQDAVIGERELGTAAWILSKPVSRTAFLLAKLTAQVVSFAALAVGIQAVVAYAQVALLADRLLEPLPYLVAVGLVCVDLLFYTALVLLLGTLFRNRGQVLLVGLGWLFASPLLVVDMLPWLVYVVPFGLPDLGAALAMGMPLGELPLRPVLLALAWTTAFALVAVWKFRHEDL